VDEITSRRLNGKMTVEELQKFLAEHSLNVKIDEFFVEA
jgi:hypothetical protein